MFSYCVERNSDSIHNLYAVSCFAENLCGRIVCKSTRSKVLSMQYHEIVASLVNPEVICIHRSGRLLWHHSVFLCNISQTALHNRMWLMDFSVVIYHHHQSTTITGTTSNQHIYAITLCNMIRIDSSHSSMCLCVCVYCVGTCFISFGQIVARWSDRAARHCSSAFIIWRCIAQSKYVTGR